MGVKFTKSHYFSTILISTMLIILCGLDKGFTKTTYSRSANFSAVQMSYADLTSLINKIQSILRSANGSSNVKWESSTVTIAQGPFVKFTYEGEITEKSFNDAPKKGVSIEYQYFNTGGAVSGVNITLEDYNRFIEVKGESSEQVDALFAMISEIINKLEITFGGSKQRFFVGSIIFFISFIICLSLPKKKYGITKLISLTLCIFGFYFPYSNYFPGSAIYAGDASYFSRNSGNIMILSLVIGLIGLIPVISWIIKMLSSTKQSHE